jgi:hypothetical protein
LYVVARRVFDRESGNPRGNGELHVRGDLLRVVREAALEVCVYRYCYGIGNEAKMFDCLIERRLIVSATQRPGEPSTRRGQRLEVHLFQGPRAASVPRVRHHKAA